MISPHFASKRLALALTSLKQNVGRNHSFGSKIINLLVNLVKQRTCIHLLRVCMHMYTCACIHVHVYACGAVFTRFTPDLGSCPRIWARTCMSPIIVLMLFLHAKRASARLLGSCSAWKRGKPPLKLPNNLNARWWEGVGFRANKEIHHYFTWLEMSYLPLVNQYYQYYWLKASITLYCSCTQYYHR